MKMRANLRKEPTGSSGRILSRARGLGRPRAMKMRANLRKEPTGSSGRILSRAAKFVSRRKAFLVGSASAE
jgi:hypothetical protein